MKVLIVLLVFSSNVFAYDYATDVAALNLKIAKCTKQNIKRYKMLDRLKVQKDLETKMLAEGVAPTKFSKLRSDIDADIVNAEK